VSCPWLTTARPTPRLRSSRLERRRLVRRSAGTGSYSRLRTEPGTPRSVRARRAVGTVGTVPAGPVPVGSVLAGLLLATAAAVLRRTRPALDATAELELFAAT